MLFAPKYYFFSYLYPFIYMNVHLFSAINNHCSDLIKIVMFELNAALTFNSFHSSNSHNICRLMHAFINYYVIAQMFMMKLCFRNSIKWKQHSAYKSLFFNSYCIFKICWYHHHELHNNVIKYAHFLKYFVQLCLDCNTISRHPSAWEPCLFTQNISKIEKTKMYHIFIYIVLKKQFTPTVWKQKISP